MGSTHASHDTTQLDHAYLAFAVEMATRMQALARTEHIEPAFFRVHVGFEPDWWRLDPSDTLGWLAIMHYGPDRLWEVEAIARCLQAHWDAGIFRYDVDMQDRFRALTPAPGEDHVSATTFEQFRQTMFEELLRPLLEVMHHNMVDAADDSEPADQRVLAAYHRYRAVWASERVRWTATVPLVNFESNLTDAVAISTHLSLAPFTPEEKERVWNSGVDVHLPPMFPPMIDFASFRRCGFRLSGAEPAHRTEPPGTAAIAEATDAITALRLLKPGDVVSPAIFLEPEVHSLAHLGTRTQGLSEHRYLWIGSPYVLDAAEVPLVQALFAEVHRQGRNSPGKALAVALRRFNQCYARPYDEDRIIDLTIALESTLLVGVNDELQYRLALRGAALLAETRPPAETQLLLETMYKARSKVVHEGRSIAECETLVNRIPSEQRPEGFARCCQDLVREILRACLTRLGQGHSIKQVNDCLDQRIVDGLR